MAIFTNVGEFLKKNMEQKQQITQNVYTVETFKFQK